MALNPRQEKFCQAWAINGNATESYEEVSNCSRAVASTMGWKWLQKVEIKQRIAEIQGEAADIAGANKESLVAWWRSVMDTPVGQVTRDHPLAQEYQDGESGIKVKMPSKESAAKELARLTGAYEPEKVEISAEGELIDLIRGVSGGKDKD